MLKKRKELKQLIKYLNKNINVEFKNDDRYEKVFFTNKKIRLKGKTVLLFSHEMKRTGAPVVLLELGKMLKKLNYTVITISLEDGDLIKDYISENIPVIVSKKMKDVQLKDAIDKKTSFYLDDLIGDFDFSVFNTITLYNFIKRYNNTDNKILWWIHEGTTIVDIPIISKSMPKQLSDNIHVRCVSDYSRKIVKKRRRNYEIDLLPYGIKTYDNKNKKEKILSEDNNRLKVAMVGSITERKGQKVLIDAIISAPYHVNENMEYYFIGSVPENDYYGEIIKKEINSLTKKYPFIHYIEKLNHEEMLEFFNSIDILVVPSYDDPLPVVASESLMLKKVIICSDMTGTASFIDDKKNGFIFKAGNYISLSKIMQYCVDNKSKLNIVSENGYELFKNTFTLDKFKHLIIKEIKSWKK